MVVITIDGISIEVKEGKKILDAARLAGVNIPTLCHLKDINEIGSCRVCVVEIEGRDHLAAACNTEAEQGMVVHTRTKKVLDAVKTNIELILANHRAECTTCIRSTNCALQELAKNFNIREELFEKNYPPFNWDSDFPLQRDDSKCIKCMRCIAVCSEVQGCNVWEFINSGSRINVGVRDGKGIREAGCTLCGQCITHCPVGALYARNDIDKVFAAIDNPEIITVANVAPAVRASWADGLDMPQEEATVGRMIGTLRMLGFDYVFDTDFAADLTVMEEASEFLERFTHKEEHHWPMFTSCCPGWVRYALSRYPELMPQLSSSKSPQQMFGAVIKTYFAEKLGVSPDKIFYTSIMPCVAKKQEAARTDLFAVPDIPDIDAVLTTREFSLAIRMKAINPRNVMESHWDPPFGDASGAGVIFGVSGGVSEAALRTAHYFLTGNDPEVEPFEVYDRTKGWRVKTVDLGDTQVRVAVVSGLKNTESLLVALRTGELECDFVEVMACPGGCAGGGGQSIRFNEELAEVRGKMLSDLDQGQPVRFAHANPSIKMIYDEYLDEPLGPTSKKLLHVQQALELHERYKNLHDESVHER
ncbi:MAG: 2Fe-2S iron-sulfur cluster binding domain-containing protein [Coriobacteriaceae bacterium]|nr:2Fe-2S iron-sulfur cluster binding domain-containing protein [Coriobacteriaceae bacterium]